jgi:hypothetical protein
MEGSTENSLGLSAHQLIKNIPKPESQTSRDQHHFPMDWCANVKGWTPHFLRHATGGGGADKAEL